MSDHSFSTQDQPHDHAAGNPQEAPGADPARDRDDNDPKDGPIGNKPGEIDLDDPKAQ